MTTKKALALPIAVAALTLGCLAGCTPASNATVPTTGAPTGSAAPQSAQLPAIPSGTGIISSTVMTGCETTGSKVTAKGTVTMPDGAKGDVAVSVSWVDSKNGAVYARGISTLPGMNAGDKRDWSTSVTLPAGAESVSCVLGAVIPK
jgi:hypothetical protein